MTGKTDRTHNLQLCNTSCGGTAGENFLGPAMLDHISDTSLFAAKFTCQTRLQIETSGSRHSLVGQVVKPLENTLKFELSSCPEGAAVLAHPQPGNMNVGVPPLPAADRTTVRFGAKVLVHATLLLVCLLPSGSAAHTSRR